MKTIKELKENCTLIAEFKMPAFVCGENKLASQHIRPTKAAIYCDNMGKFYLVKYILRLEISEYNNYEYALNKFISFITDTAL